MPCSIHNEEERLRNGPVSEDYNEKERALIIYPRPEDILCEEREEEQRISLSAVLGEKDDSVNTTIFLELILVIVGETFKL